MSVDEFHQSYNENEKQTPVLVKEALAENLCEELCDIVVSNDKLEVDLQRKRPNLPATFYNVNIRQAIEAIMHSSNHNDALFCFEEGLLDELSILQKCRESVFPDEDLFPYFPEFAKSTDCLIPAGEGATSTLHRDPYEWMGTSLCLEGSKVWRFIEPPGEGPLPIDDMLESYRLPSTAWGGGDEEQPLSAGWQSDKSLFKTRTSNIPSARELQSISNKYEYMLDAAMSTEQLTPSTDLIEETPTTLWTTVQTSGDLLVIPAYWWHQTYGLEPSVAVASQRCSSREIEQVLRHISTTTGLGHTFDEMGGVNDLDLDSAIQKFFFSLVEEMEKK